jgi:hypothetical protein
MTLEKLYCNVWFVVLGIFFYVGCYNRQGDFIEFQNEIKRNIDSIQLQEWAISIIKSHDRSYQLSIEDIPVYLKTSSKYQPGFAIFSFGGDNQGDNLSLKENSILIMWGSGFGHWGLMIGDQSFRISERDFPHLQIHMWIPGVYFVLEIK